MAGQLVLPFGVEPALEASNFITAPCNEQAVAYVMRWPEWPAPAAALCGPAGCGKSHLAKVWQKKAGARAYPASLLTPETAAALAGEPVPSILIEDVDAEDPTPARDLALLALFDRRGGILLTGRALPAEWPVAVSDLKSRFQSLVAFPMWAPDDALLSALVRKHFADRQLEVPQTAVQSILMHVERTPAAIAAFIERVDTKALSEKRSITARFIAEVIASEIGPSVPG
jgi:chromosomal replication initiation ATPase DnaA